jgi:ubiquinone/menaquinone biosynthesis C-methylase UbiE
MIARLLERRERDGVDNLEAAVMDGQALDLPDDSFDAVVSVFGFMFFLDQDAGLRELHRVLHAEGRAAIVTWGPPERNPGITIQREAVVAAVPDLPEPPGPPAIFSLSDPQAMEARMRAAGFEEAHAEPVAREWTFDSAEDLWALREASPVFEGLADVIGDRWESVHQELIRLVDARFGGGPVMFRAEALLTTGRRP